MPRSGVGGVDPPGGLRSAAAALSSPARREIRRLRRPRPRDVRDGPLGVPPRDRLPPRPPPSEAPPADPRLLHARGVRALDGRRRGGGVDLPGPPLPRLLPRARPSRRDLRPGGGALGDGPPRNPPRPRGPRRD